MKLRGSLALAFVAVLGAVACRQILGVEDLKVDGGAGNGDGGADGSNDSGGSGDAGDAANACRNMGTAPACFACCTAPLQQRGAFFGGAVKTCACQTCQGACPVYCSPGSGADNSACDMCVLSALQPGGSCEDAGASQTCAGCSAADDCLRQCPQPAGGKPECGGFMRSDCYDCCNNLYSQLSSFYEGAAQDCACRSDGGACATASGCDMYCGSPSSLQVSCSDCALQALTDGGPCAAVGEQSAACGSDCRSYLRCMGNCQRYFNR